MAKLDWSQEPTQPHENNGGASVQIDKSTGNDTQRIPVPSKDGSQWTYPSPEGKK